MEIVDRLKENIQQAFQKNFNASVAQETIQLQPTRKEFEGSYTLVTFSLAKICQQSPNEIAKKIGQWLQENAQIVAGYQVVNGFLNITLTDQIWLERLKYVEKGISPAQGKKVLVEFSSPNTNKPLHLGHLRNNFLGHAMAEILKAVGHEVHKVDLVNDRGIHICKSMQAYTQFGQGETPTTAGIKGDHLVGKYYVKFDQEYKKQVAALTQKLGNVQQAEKEAPLMKSVQTMLQQWEAGDTAVLALWKKMNSWVYEGFAATYKQIGIVFDRTYYESQTYLLGKGIVKEGLQKGVFYKKQDGSVWVNLTEAGLDEKLVLRADGTSVYMTQDMGTADLRYQDYHFDEFVYVVGNEQNYHFKVLFHILKKLGRNYASGMYHLAYGMVDLPTGKMKSREGTVVDADDLIKEMIATAAIHTQQLGKIEQFSDKAAQQLYHTLAMGALKYFLLKVEPAKRILFDPAASIDFQGHTGPFIQYTHARIAAIIRKAKQQGIDFYDATTKNLGVLKDTERAVIIYLDQFSTKLQEAATRYAPAVIAQYVFDLAKAYNRLYAEVPILHEPKLPLQKFRIYLSAMVGRMIRKNMQLLGIDVPEKM